MSRYLTPMEAEPRKPGETWWSSYWHTEYQVVAVEESPLGLPLITVDWADGRRTRHSTAVGNDKLIRLAR